MKRYKWQILLALALIVLAVMVYLIHYAIFEDPHHIFIYMVGDLAFLPVEVLLVTLIVHRLLTEREKRALLEKLNMVIGSFFSEVGARLLAVFSDCDPRLDDIKQNLVVASDWSAEEFARVKALLRKYDYGVDMQKTDLENLTGLLKEKRDFLLRLLENPVLLEHDAFTQLLQAVFHLTEELDNREKLTGLPQSDYEHLANDIKRVYVLLVREWLDYMEYTKDNYPYLFSLSMRTNPFDQSASPVVG